MTLELQLPALGRAPYHGLEGRISLPVDPRLVARAAPPPAVARVLDAVASGGSTPTEIAALVASDPALTRHVLHLASSVALGSGAPVDTVDEATKRLGVSVIRDFTLVYMVASMIRELDASTFRANGALGVDLVGFCEQSLRRAATALVAARRVGYEEPCEAFTAGLMQDFGLLVMAVLCPDRAAHLDQCRARPAAERLLWERALCGAAHTDIIAPFAASWGIPGAIASAIAAHHDDVIVIADRRAQRLAELLRLADGITDLCQVNATESCLARANMRLAALRTRAPMTLRDLLAETAETIRELAVPLGFPDARPVARADLLTSPTRNQARLGVGYEEKARRIEQLLREKERLARELRGGAGLRSRDQTLDPTTGVSTRRELCTMLERLLVRTKEHAGPLSVLIVELDNVEAGSLRAGEPDAVAVMRAAARRLKPALRIDDVIGRLGADLPGFGILLPGCDEVSGPRVASRLAAALFGGGPVELPSGGAVEIAASLGGTTAPVGCELAVEDVVTLSELALERHRVEGGPVVWRVALDPH